MPAYIKHTREPTSGTPHRHREAPRLRSSTGSRNVQREEIHRSCSNSSFLYTSQAAAHEHQIRVDPRKKHQKHVLESGKVYRQAAMSMQTPLRAVTRHKTDQRRLLRRTPWFDSFVGRKVTARDLADIPPALISTPPNGEPVSGPLFCTTSLPQCLGPLAIIFHLPRIAPNFESLPRALYATPAEGVPECLIYALR